MRDFYDISILLSRYEQDIDNSVLRKAFDATCKKRSTESLKTEASQILKAIETDEQLHAMWQSYQKKYPYAAEIAFEEVLDSTRALCNRI